MSSEKRSEDIQKILHFARDNGYFFCDEFGIPCVKVNVGTHFEVWHVDGELYKDHIISCMLNGENFVSMDAVNFAVAVLRNECRKSGRSESLPIRIGGDRNTVYFDLTDDKYRVIEIDADGWRLRGDSPIFFRRPNGFIPVPFPSNGGNLPALIQLLNITPDSGAFKLIVAWLIQAICPVEMKTPYPLLVLTGTQGSGKSSASRILKSILDPNHQSLRTLPKDERDLAIAASCSWILNFDNLSGMSQSMSDALCRLATGGGYSTRKLYSDDIETVFFHRRPIILNGITDFVRRHDLIDRSLFVDLPPIPKSERKPESEIFELVDRVRPDILAGLFDAVSTAIRNADITLNGCLPRLADFATWIHRAEASLPWEPGEFMEVYAENRQDRIEIAIENDKFTLEFYDFVEKTVIGYWIGTSSELLDDFELFVINNHTEDWLKESKRDRFARWPLDAARLSKRLREAASFLRELNVRIDFDYRQGKQGRRMLRIEYSKHTADAETCEGIPGF